MANFFTDLNNFIKQKPLEYMHEFGIEIEPSTQIPAPYVGVKIVLTGEVQASMQIRVIAGQAIVTAAMYCNH